MSCCQDSPYSQDRKSIASIDSANVLLLYIYYLASSFTVHCALLLYALMTDMHRIKSFHFEMFFSQPLQWLITYRVSKKMSFLGKTVIKLKKKWLRKWSLKSFLLQFWKSQCPFRSKYPEFFKTPQTFAFLMSLKEVMVVFPQNNIFLGHPVHWIIMSFTLPPTCCLLHS